MRCDADRADAGTAATVRDAESLVQVEMADIRSDVAGAAEADLGIEIGPVHVNPAASGVYLVANLADGFLKHAVRGRIGHHEGGKRVLVLLDFFVEVGEVDVAIRIAETVTTFMPAITGAGRVRAVRGGRDEADVATGVAMLCKCQARMARRPAYSPCRTGVGLKGKRRRSR